MRLQGRLQKILNAFSGDITTTTLFTVSIERTEARLLHDGAPRSALARQVAGTLKRAGGTETVRFQGSDGQRPNDTAPVFNLHSACDCPTSAPATRRMDSVETKQGKIERWQI